MRCHSPYLPARTSEPLRVSLTPDVIVPNGAGSCAVGRPRRQTATVAAATLVRCAVTHRCTLSFEIPSAAPVARTDVFSSTTRRIASARFCSSVAVAMSSASVTCVAGRSAAGSVATGGVVVRRGVAASGVAAGRSGVAGATRSRVIGRGASSRSVSCRDSAGVAVLSRDDDREVHREEGGERRDDRECDSDLRRFRGGRVRFYVYPYVAPLSCRYGVLWSDRSRT